MTPAPQQFRWTGTAMVPLRLPLAQRVYSLNEIYRLAAEDERNMAAHRGYFASIREAFLNLPEHLAGQFANEEALRKFALIKTGWHDERTYACASTDEAERMAAFIRPIDSFAIVTVRDTVVTVYTAKSQATRGPNRMAPEDFKKSCRDVQDYLAALVGVTAAELQKNAEVVA